MTKARKKDCTALTALTITATTAAAINDESDGSVVMRQCKMQQDIHSRNSWKLKKISDGQLQTLYISLTASISYAKVHKQLSTDSVIGFLRHSKHLC